MPENINSIKQFTVVMPSGTAATAQPFSMGGYSKIGIFAPVITSAYIGFAVAPSGSPAVGPQPATDGPYFPLVDKLGNNISAITPGGTGNVALASDQLTALQGYSGPVMISASVGQTAARTFWVHLKT